MPLAAEGEASGMAAGWNVIRQELPLNGRSRRRTAR
jgi:hypothetical protein